MVQEEIVKQQIKNFVKKRLEREQEKRKKNENGESLFLLILCGTVFAVFFLVMIPFAAIGNPEDVQGASGDSIIAAAQAELEMSDLNVGGQKYKSWYGINGNWCAMFVSYCADQCGYIEKGIMPKSASVAVMAEWYKERSRWIPVRDENGTFYEPKAGDIIFFQNNSSHVGIVTGYDESTKTITTIEGNTGSSTTEPYHAGSRVKQKTYALTHGRISGYGIPDYGAASEEIQAGYIKQIYFAGERRDKIV